MSPESWGALKPAALDWRRGFVAISGGENPKSGAAARLAQLGTRIDKRPTTRRVDKGLAALAGGRVPGLNGIFRLPLPHDLEKLSDFSGMIVRKVTGLERNR